MAVYTVSAFTLYICARFYLLSFAACVARERSDILFFSKAFMFQSCP